MTTSLRQVLVVFTFVCGLCAAPALFAATDDEIMTEYRQKVSALRDRLVGMDDAEEQLRIQREIKRLTDETMPRLSEKARSMMNVMMQVIEPFQLDVLAYSEACAKHFGSELAGFGGIKQREDITARIDAITKLSKMNDGVLRRVTSMSDDMDKALSGSKLSALEKRGLLAGFNSGVGRQIGPLKAIRTLDTQIFGKFTEALRHLDTHWGKWKSEDDGSVSWTDAAAETEFVTMMIAVQEFAARQTTAQELANERAK